MGYLMACLSGTNVPCQTAPQNYEKTDNIMWWAACKRLCHMDNALWTCIIQKEYVIQIQSLVKNNLKNFPVSEIFRNFV